MNQKNASRGNRLHLTRLAVGLLFFCNPNINLFDILPDFIGCILILSAIEPAVDVLPYFSDMRERFRKLLWISLSKIPAAFLMMAIYAGDTSQRAIIAVFALTYAIIELLVLFPAFRMLYEGMFYLGERFLCDVTIRPTGKQNPATLLSFTLLFFSVRAAGASLPEFALVPVTNTADTDIGLSWLPRFYPFLTLFAFLVVLVFGIAFAIRSFRYFRLVDKDCAVAEVVAAHRAEKAELLERKSKVSLYKSALAILAIAIGLGIDLIFDNQNILPDPLAGILLTVAMLMLAKRFISARYAAAAAFLYTVASTVSYVLSTRYFSEYDYSSLYDHKDALELYAAYLNAALIETVLAALTIAAIAWVLLRLIPTAVIDRGKGCSLQTAQLRRGFRIETVLLSVIGILTAIAGYAYAILSQYIETVLLDTDREGAEALGGAISADLPAIPYLWLWPLLLSLAYLAVGIHLTTRLRAETEHSYLEEY